MCSIWLYIKYLNINKQNLGKTNKQQYIQIKINRKLKFNRKMYQLSLWTLEKPAEFICLSVQNLNEF